MEQIYHALSFTSPSKDLHFWHAAPRASWPEFQQHDMVLHDVHDDLGVQQLEPIHEAAALGSVSILSFLLHQVGADVNAATSDGNTVLHIAAYEGYADAIEFLLSSGANPSLRNKQVRASMQKEMWVR